MCSVIPDVAWSAGNRDDGWVSTTPDYPQMAATRGRIEPAPRRVRGYLDDELVFDTTAARYVWEVPYYPQYYIPLADVRAEFLRDEDHPQKVQLGPSRLHSLVGARRTHEAAARVFDGDGDGPVAGMVRFEWDTLRWFEEDEPIFGHPRNPYSRVDALRSHRHVRVELDGVVLADTRAPCPAIRNRFADKVLHRPHRHSVRAPRTQSDPVPLPVQGSNVGLLVRAHRRSDSSRPCLDLSLSAARRRCDRQHGRVLQREARHRSSTMSPCLARKPSSADSLRPQRLALRRTRR